MSSNQKLKDSTFNINKVWSLALAASWGSFIFGYNIGAFASCHPSVSATLNWGDNQEFYVVIMTAMMPFGAMFGSLVSGIIAHKIGRRKALMLTDSITIIGSCIIVMPYTASFAIGRFVTGFAAGSFSCLVTLYINEVAPVEVAGKIGGIVQFQVTFGIVVAYALALALPTGDYKTNPLNYLWMGIFAFQSFFALLQFLIFFTLHKHDTPKWLCENLKFDLALQSLKQVYCETEALEIVNSLEESYKKSLIELGTDDIFKTNDDPTYSEILGCKKNLGKMIRLGCFLNFFKQFSGINAILSYSTTIFGKIGGGTFLARVFTLIIGLVNMASTLAVFPVIGKVGRKRIILLGGIGMTLSLSLMGFFCTTFKSFIPAHIIFIIIFIVFYEGSIGPVCWIYCGEILTTRAMSVSVFVNWLSTFIVVFTFPVIMDVIQINGAFFLYSGLNLIGTVYFFFDMAETKGLNKAQIKQLLIKKR